MHTKISVVEPEGKRPLGRHRNIWECNAVICLQEIWEVVWARVMCPQVSDQRHTVTNTWNTFDVIYSSGNFLARCGIKIPKRSSFYRRTCTVPPLEWFSFRYLSKHCTSFYYQRWAGHVTRMGETRVAYRVLVGKPDGKSTLGRPSREWQDNIRPCLKEIGCLNWLKTGT